VSCHFTVFYHTHIAEPGGKQTFPCEPAIVASGESAEPVQAVATNLVPNKDYVYEVVISGPGGELSGGQESFHTPGPPEIVSVAPKTVGEREATLAATINPQGQHAVYHFEFGRDSSYGTVLPVPDGDLGAESADELVTQAVSGLEPATTYHYRVVATGENGTATSADHAFTTAPAEGATADSCPNAAVRAQQHAGLLADCRAWEMVSPPDKNGSNVIAGQGVSRSATNGGAAQYASLGSFADPNGTSLVTYYIAERNDGIGRGHGFSHGRSVLYWEGWSTASKHMGFT